MADAPNPRYRTTPMLAAYAGEDVPGNEVWGIAVQYLSDSQRAAFRLHIANGLIYDAHDNLLDTADASSLHTDQARAIFVMDDGGNFFASKWHSEGEFHHSSLISGQPAAAVGEIEVQNGRLIALSDRSGHYRPQRAFTGQAIDELRKNGVDFVNVQLDIISDD
jgi:hypothetical protein